MPKAKTKPKPKAKPLPVARPVPDMKQFGCDWSARPDWPLVTRRQYCARWNKGNVSQFEQRKAIIQSLWHPADYEMHFWSDRRLHSVCDHNFVIWMGPASCVAGHTRILDPTTGEQPTIRSLYAHGRSPMVMTLLGPKRAGVPFIKGCEELYLVSLSNGSKFSCTAKHRVLTPTGYVHVGRLSIGDTLLSYAPCPPVCDRHSASSQILQASTSESYPSVRELDAPNSLRITEGSQAHCSVYSDHDDELLPSAKGIGQSFSPSQGDAPAYKAYASDHSDAPDNAPRDNHPYLRPPPLSKGDVFRLSLPSETPALLHTSVNRPVRADDSSLPLSQSRPDSIHHWPIGELDSDSFHRHRLCRTDVLEELEASFGLRVTQSAVTAITKTPPKLFYDLTVPDAGHYFAEGAIHHNSGKTTCAAAIAVQYWLEAPWETAVIVCSTTKDMLRKRIWGQIARLWNRLPAKLAYKGVMTDANCTIRWEDNDMVNAIMGVAVADGPVEEAINNLIGIHTKRVFLILDEMQGIREAIMGALPNMAKNPESKFLGMGNPTSMMSMLCKYAEPIGGWSSVIRGETKDWAIDEGEYRGTGQALFFDGRKSPAVVDPAWGRHNSWMIDKDQVDKAIAKKGENSPDVWSMTIGWPPPVGTDNTVLDVQIIETFRCREKAIWTDGYMTGAALDPAFVEGGDSKILQFFKYGRVNDALGSRWVIELGEWLEVPIDTSSEETVEYQIVYYCRERCQSKGISPGDFGVDMTGIGRGLKMIFDKEMGSCTGIEFGGNPSDLPVGETGKTAKEVFDRRVSELNIMLRYFANSNGLRGISKEVEEQACQRKTEHKIKQMVETKAQMKKRTGRSPDHLDAALIAVDMCRQRGAFPGDFAAPPPDPVQQHVKAIESDAYFDERNITEDEDWSRDYALLL